jgi:hypothetical protein
VNRNTGGEGVDNIVLPNDKDVAINRLALGLFLAGVILLYMLFTDF